MDWDFAFALMAGAAIGAVLLAFARRSAGFANAVAWGSGLVLAWLFTSQVMPQEDANALAGAGFVVYVGVGMLMAL